MIECKICNKPFDADKSFHIHLKKHGMYQAEYYCKYYPRKSLHYQRQIPFKNKQEYFDQEFIDLTEFMMWENSTSSDLVKAKCLDMLNKRIKEKEYSYAPFYNEIKTLMLPPISIYKKHFGSYTKACKSIGMEPLFNKSMPKEFFDFQLQDFEMLVDTREQDPLPFKKTKKEKLYVGDYLINNSAYSYTYVDRKSETDFLGTLASGVTRFEEEIKKAVALDSYLFVVVESTIEKIKYNQKKFSRKTNLDYVFHNMRQLTHRYPRKLQFLFSGDRNNSMDLIPKLLYYGNKLWNVDIQYFLDNELGNR